MARRDVKSRTIKTRSAGFPFPSDHQSNDCMFDSSFPQGRVTLIDRRLLAITSELSEIKYRLVVIDQRLSAFTRR